MIWKNMNPCLYFLSDSLLFKMRSTHLSVDQVTGADKTGMGIFELDLNKSYLLPSEVRIVCLRGSLSKVSIVFNN